MDQSEEDFEQEQLPAIRQSFDSTQAYINAAGERVNTVLQHPIVVEEPLQLDLTDPKAISGALLSVFCEGAPAPGRPTTEGAARKIQIVEILNTPEVHSILVSGGVPSASRLAKQYYDQAVIEDSDHYPGGIIGSRVPGINDRGIERTENVLTTELFVEALANLGTDVTKVHPILNKVRIASINARETHENVEVLSQEVLLSAADRLRADQTLSPSELTSAVHILINASMQGRADGGCREKVLSTIFGIEEARAKLFLDTSFAINPDATLLFGEGAISISEQGAQFEIEKLLKGQYSEAVKQSVVFLSDERYSSDKITEVSRSQIWKFITTTSELAQTVETDEQITSLQQNLMEIAGRFFAGDRDVYEVEELGSVAFEKDQREVTKELQAKQPKKVEVDTNLPSERLLGILSRVTSKDRRFLVGGDPTMVQSDIEQIELIRETLVERNPELEQTILTRLSQHFMALGGEYLGLGDDAIKGVTDQNAREALIRSMGYARAMEGVSPQDEAKLQAQKICKDSEPTVRSLTDEQKVRATQLAEQMRQDESNLVLRLSSPESLVDVLFGSKRRKSMWETSSTNGALGSMDSSYAEERLAAERVMGIADHIENPTLIEPAISTFLRPSDEPPISTDGYGFIEISLKKDAVRQRSVYVDGDATNQANDGEHKFMKLDDAIKTAAEKQILVEDGVIKRPGGPNEQRGWDYVEGLILGGVSREDIGPEIRIYTDRGEITFEEADKLEKIITDRDPSIIVTII